MVFKRYFPNVIPLPCNYRCQPVKLNEFLVIPSADALLLSTNVFHELIGIVWYRARMMLKLRQRGILTKANNMLMF